MVCHVLQQAEMFTDFEVGYSNSMGVVEAGDAVIVEDCRISDSNEWWVLTGVGQPMTEHGYICASTPSGTPQLEALPQDFEQVVDTNKPRVDAEDDDVYGGKCAYSLPRQ